VVRKPRTGRRCQVTLYRVWRGDWLDREGRWVGQFRVGLDMGLDLGLDVGLDVELGTD